MGSLLSGPKLPAQQPTTPMPVQDDEAARRERLKAIAKTSAEGGRSSTMLTASRMGDTSKAETRSGTGYGSQILTG